MKSASEAICLQEVPDEISLSLAISNCPCHCDGCHSKYLWEDCGRDAFEVLKNKLFKDIPKNIDRNKVEDSVLKACEFYSKHLKQRENQR